MTVQELLEKKKLPFTASGQDYVIKCLNPDHDDSSPSMRIDKVLGIFRCPSCNFKGNIFYYYGEKIDKLSTARETVSRKLDTIRAQSIGLKIPVDSVPLSAAYRVSLDTLNKFEAFRTSNQDLLGRVVFPIRDLKGKITCFIGRAEDPYEKVRYKVFPSGRSIPLYPLNTVEPLQGRVLIVEGIFDMLNLYEHGCRNVLCVLGANNLNAENFKLLKIIGVSGIDILFDADKPGQEAALKTKDELEGLEFHVRNINLKSGDPGDMSQSHVVNLMKKLYN